MNPTYSKATFQLSAMSLEQAPADIGYEVAFAGRSNAGKSSAINAITNNKKLARVSKEPGRTQCLNFFALDSDRRIVDLPGYGYATVPLRTKERWQHLMESYLECRHSLQGLIIAMDIRHPLSSYDLTMLEWGRQANLAVHILLTKSDKLKRGPALDVLHRVRRTLEEQRFSATAQLFSVLKTEGVDEVHTVLDGWLHFA